MRGTVYGAVVGLIALAGCGSGYCDRDSAEAALRGSAPGDTVTLGNCTLDGPLHVPPGVTLEGSGETIVVAPDTSGGIVALGGDETVVRQLAVRVDGIIGILARGGGRVRIEDVTVSAQRGIGIGADGLDALALTRVSLEGPIDGTTAMDPTFLRVIPAPPLAGPCPTPGTCDCEPGETRSDGAVCDATGRFATVTATHGIYAQNVDNLTAEDVEVTGFAELGVVVRDSVATWSGGRIADTLGTAFRQVGGSSSITGIAVERTYEGLRGVPPHGIAVTDGAAFEAIDPVVNDNDRFGVVLVGSTGRVEGLVAERNGDTALWLGGTSAFEVLASSFSDNRFASLVVSESSGVHVEDTSIENTVAREVVVGATPVRLGDGIHLHASLSDIRFTGLTLAGNERAGAVVDLGATGTPDIVFSLVTVDASGAALGAVAGRPDGSFSIATTTPGGWDTGIMRLGDAVVNDSALAGSIQALDVLAPEIPSPTDAVSVVAPMF